MEALIRWFCFIWMRLSSLVLYEVMAKKTTGLVPVDELALCVL